MIEKKLREVTDLDEVIFLLNHGVSIFLKLACKTMHINDDVHPWGKSPFYLSGEAKRNFDSLFEGGAIAGQATGKASLTEICLWNVIIHGEQSTVGKALALKWEIGAKFNSIQHHYH
jgi:hypothetical protein